MSNIDDALIALRDVVATVEPIGQPPLSAAYAYPNEQATMPIPIEADILPVAIVHRRTGRRTALGSLATGQARHVWIANIDLLLLPGPLVSEEQIREADTLFAPWLITMQAVLYANVTLDGTADMIGGGFSGSDLFEYMDTHLQWFAKVYWGIRFELPVKQTWPQAMIR